MKDLLLEKIRNSRVINSPFPNVNIDDFLPNDYFEEFSKRLHIEGKVDDRELIEEAFSRNFVPQDFPVSTDSVIKYLRYLRRRAKKERFMTGSVGL